MSIWAEIKHSINSDLSKPLNELINGTKGLVASNNLYSALYLNTISVSSPSTTINVPVKITTNWAGSFNVKCNLHVTLPSTSSSGGVPSLKIYKNGNEYKSLTGVYSDQDDFVSIECTCATKDVFTFVLSRSTRNTQSAVLSNLGIYADLIDISGVTIESI